MVNGTSTRRGTLDDLEENTTYFIIVQATRYNVTSSDSNAVSVTTYADGK